MIALIQRVSSARVTVDGRPCGEIGPGILALVGIQRGDGRHQAKRLLQRLLQYRIFPDKSGRMNRSLADTGGELLLVPQFTLAADTRKGNRPSFTPAASPAEGEGLFGYLLDEAQRCHDRVVAGRFGAEMQVSLTNDGPVTFWLEAAPD